MFVLIIAKSSDITQIAAVCDNKTFHRCVRSEAEISLEATKVTGITPVGIMKHNGTVVLLKVVILEQDSKTS